MIMLGLVISRILGLKEKCCYRIRTSFIFYELLVKFDKGSLERKVSSVSDFVCVYSVMVVRPNVTH